VDWLPLGTAFTLNWETAAGWVEITGEQLPGVVLPVAEFEPRYQPMLFTRIRVHNRHVLEDFVSGLTSPRTLDLTLAPRKGDTICFHYQLGENPHLLAKVKRDDVP